MRKGIFLVSLLISVFISSCKKDSSKPISSEDENAEFVNGLSSEQAEVLDGILHIDADSTDVMLEDGTILADAKRDHPDWFNGSLKNDPLDGKSPKEIKNILLLRILDRAEFLVKKDNFTTEYIDDFRPKQRGLVYAYGGKDYKNRVYPKGACNNYHVYGLDCSGFLFLILHEAGLPIQYKEAKFQAQPSYLQDALNKLSPNSGFKVEVFYNNPKIEAGDLVYWTRLPKTDKDGHKTVGSKPADHIGMALRRRDGSLAVFQSNGGNEADDCTKNVDPKRNRGPNKLDLTSIYWFDPVDSKWQSIRITAPNEPPPPPPPTYKIGDAAFGGIVFYIDPTGEHGMVRSTDAIAKSIKWDVTKQSDIQETGATDSSFGGGINNTNIIINKLGKGDYAASLCAEYSAGGFNDWWLPSIGEVILMNKTLTNGQSSLNWSSTEIPNANGSKSMAYKGNGNGHSASFKYIKANVFAVRAF
ncbi:hypothetical protein F9K33_07900 [bacterium]|nr:MAG: hypothetical protein F9K33_07900 [bacterium]